MQIFPQRLDFVTQLLIEARKTKVPFKWKYRIMGYPVHIKFSSLSNVHFLSLLRKTCRITKHANIGIFKREFFLLKLPKVSLF